MKLLVVDEAYGGRFRNISRQFRGGDVVAAKLDVLSRRAGSLRTRSAITVGRARLPLDQLPDLLARSRADAVLFAPSWHHSAATFGALLDAIPPPSARPALILFDTFDQATSPYFGLLPQVDLYVKSQVLRDRSRYGAGLAGGNNLADWVHRALGFDLGSWQFGSIIPPGWDHRLVAGWNLGVSRVYRALAAQAGLLGPAWRHRPIELHRRFTIPDPARAPRWEWYQEYRRFCGLRINELCGDFRQTGSEPVTPPVYRRELRQSRIVFSPFGWGEVCFRDFEAVASGAVLVKPDMSHLETYPDIYQDRQTYMAVRWDLSDLPTVCRWLLDHPAEAETIARQARDRLFAYVGQGQFDHQLRAIVDRLPRRGDDPNPNPSPT